MDKVSILALSRFSKYMFAKQMLREQNHRIFRGRKEILVFDGVEPLYNIEQIETKIPIGESLVEGEKIEQIRHFHDLRKAGYKIISKELLMPWANLRVGYVIVPESQGGHLVDKIPKDHIVEYNVSTKQYRLVGPNSGPTGIGKWTRPVFTADTVRRTKQKFNYDYYKDNYFKVMAKQRGFDVTEISYKPIKEVPVLISQSKELVCLPETKDENVIGIVGERGQGKTFLETAIASRIYWKQHKCIGFVNDPYEQTFSLATPIQNPMFVEQLQKINEHPMPMPVGWLYPKTNTLNELRMFGKDFGMGFTISFPFKKAVMDYSNFFKGKADWDMEKSAPLLRLIAEDISACTTFPEMYSVIAKANLTAAGATDGFKIPENSKAKVIKVLQDVYNQQILDISTGVPSMWKIMDARTGETREYSPFAAMMACRLVPAIMTRNLQSKHYYPQYMKYMLDDIFDNQTKDEYFNTNKIVTIMVVDEITNIASTLNKSVASESLVTCVTEGRPNRIGFIYTTQNYSVIDRRIRENTTHLFSFRLKKEAKFIRSDFDLTEHEEESMKSLQKFEVMALTSNKYIVYNEEGKRRESEPNEVFRGFALPPLCEPSSPR